MFRQTSKLLHNHKLNPEIRHKESDKESADNQFEGHPETIR